MFRNVNSLSKIHTICNVSHLPILQLCQLVGRFFQESSNLRLSHKTSSSPQQLGLAPEHIALSQLLQVIPLPGDVCPLACLYKPFWSTPVYVTSVHTSTLQEGKEVFQQSMWVWSLSLNSQAGISPVGSRVLLDGTCHLSCLLPCSDSHIPNRFTPAVWHGVALGLPTWHHSISNVVLSTTSLFCPRSPCYLMTQNNPWKLWSPWMT